MSKSVDFLKKYYPEIIAATALVYGMVLRFQCFATRSLFIDEIRQLEAAEGPFKPFWQRLTYGCEMQAFPGEYLLNWPMAALFKNNPWAVTSPHIIATLVGYACLYWIGKKYFKTVIGWLVAFSVYTLNSSLIYHSFEIRPYAVLPTLALAAFLMFEPFFSREPLALKQKIGLAVFSVLTVFYHTFGMWMLCYINLYFLLRELAQRPLSAIFQGKAIYAISCGIVCLALFVWYLTGSEFFFLKYKENIFQFIPNPVVNFTGWFKGVIGNLLGNRIFYILLPGCLLAMTLPTPKRKELMGFLLTLVILPISLLLISDLKKEYWFLQRQFVWVMPLFAFWLGWCWDYLSIWLLERSSVSCA